MIQKITQKDDIYPDSLRKIKNPPKQLYLEGDINLLNANIISIIGSRSCTENGIKLATKFAKGLSKQGIVDTSFIGLDSTPIAANTSQNNPKSFLSSGSYGFS